MKSEFYWGLVSSLLVALGLSIFQHLQFLNNLKGIEKQAHLVGFSFTLLPFVGIYFVVGVVLLFSKKSEKFAKGLLLSALLLFLTMLVLSRLSF